MIPSSTNAAVISPPYPVRPARVEYAPNVYPPLTVRDLLRPVPITAGAVEYVRQKPTVGAAAVNIRKARRR